MFLMKKASSPMRADTASVPELMELKEVAAYLRLGERTVYGLVKDRKIPCSRVTGKWLFPKRLIDLWIDENTEHVGGSKRDAQAPRALLVGSHDPLLEWAVRESGCELGLLCGGSRDGLARLARGEASIAGIHLYDRRDGAFNLSALAELPPNEWVAIRMAARQQGLLLAAGNPHGIGNIDDLASKKVRVVLRQSGAGSRELWDALREQAGLPAAQFNTLESPALTEGDMALAIRNGMADAGLAIESVARSADLHFVPLMWEQFDLVMTRRQYFSLGVQKLFACIMSEAFARHTATLGGYDITERGGVVYNA
jgi:excisionase family DNA binding protein